MNRVLCILLLITFLDICAPLKCCHKSTFTRPRQTATSLCLFTDVNDFLSTGTSVGRNPFLIAAEDLSVQLQRYAANNPANTISPEVNNDAVVGGFLTTKDLQDLALVLLGTAYIMYDRRPQGDSRDDLVEVGKSTFVPNQLGVFAKTFIPEGTVLGVYPGYLKTKEQAFASKVDDKAVENARRYTWLIDGNKLLDPTNERGAIDLQLTYLFGLGKVSTTMCRINEPPMGMDVNAVTRVEGNRVIISAERDLVRGEEIFLDYGKAYDRSDYQGDSARLQGLKKKKILTEEEMEAARARLAAEREVAEREMQKLQPVSGGNSREDEEGGGGGGGGTDVAPIDTTLKGGFIDKLSKNDDKYRTSGIISPAEGSKMFSDRGEAIFANPEDQELIDSIYGRDTATTATSAATSSRRGGKGAAVPSAVGSDGIIGGADDTAASRSSKDARENEDLSSMFKKMLGTDAAAALEEEDEATAAISTTGSEGGDSPKSIFDSVVGAGKKTATSSRSSTGTSSGGDSSSSGSSSSSSSSSWSADEFGRNPISSNDEDMDSNNSNSNSNTGNSSGDIEESSASSTGKLSDVSNGDGKSTDENGETLPLRPALDPSEADALKQRLDDLSDEQVERVFEKMRANFGQRIREQYDQEQVTKEPVNMPKAPAVDSNVRKEYAKEFQQIEEELEKMYNNPIGVLKEMLKEPEKYIDQEEGGSDDAGTGIDGKDQNQ